MVARTLAPLAVLGISLVIAEGLRSMPPGPAMIGLAIFGAALAPMISGAPTPLAVGLGATAALAWALLRPIAPVPAGASFVVLLYAPRSLRARDAAATILQLAVAAAGGAAASWLLLRYGGRGPMLHGVAIGMAALLVGAPFALGVEHPRVAALRALARRSRGPSRARLLRAAALQRRAAASTFPIAKAEQRRLDRAFHTVLRLAEARAEGGAIDLAAIDRALSAHVVALARLTRALRARWASAEALAGHDAGDVTAAGERVAAEAAALDQLA